MGICKQNREGQEELDWNDPNNIARRFALYKFLLDKIQEQTLRITDEFSNEAIKGIMEVKKNTKAKKPSMIKKLVSKSKIRYQDDQYNLDLAYITKQIIAMGFPSTKIESVYRNSRTDIRNFLRKYHGNDYKVYNLCMEKKWHYNNEDFDSNIQTAKFPFRDHCPCDILMMLEFCIDVILFYNIPDSGLSKRGKAAAVHCKAGKGRTGVMICAYLIFIGACQSAEEAFQIYGERRSKKRKGITIPSQKRFIYYFDAFLKQELKQPYIDQISPIIKEPFIYQGYMEKLALRGLIKSIDIGPIKQS